MTVKIRRDDFTTFTRQRALKPPTQDTAAISRMAQSLLGAARTRLEILATEIEEERVRLEQMLLFALGAVFCLAMGIVLSTFFIVVLLSTPKNESPAMSTVSLSRIRMPSARMAFMASGTFGK